jgi:hypothetical protein
MVASTGGSGGTAPTGGGGATGDGGASGDGGMTGDAGACGSLGSDCRSNSDCCSAACNGTCGQPEGQMCYAADDCSSGTCVDGVCACSVDGGCAVDADCCVSGQVCEQNALLATESGDCCSPPGGPCFYGNVDGGFIGCCVGECLNYECQCQPAESRCVTDRDCCEGKCKSLPASGVGAAFCASGAGQACSEAADCESLNCVDGSCGQCSESNGSCASDDDCCSGRVCANFPPTYGLNCCVLNGLPCNVGPDCCSEACGSDGTCSCAPTSAQCFDDRGCCAEGACMPQPLNGGSLACCQADGEGCLVDGDCCSGTCQNEKCGCVATGGLCGSPGQVAPEGAQACCSGQCGAAGACL